MRGTRVVLMVSLCSLPSWGGARADDPGRELLARGAARAPSVALPTRARRSSIAPSRTATPQLARVRNLTHPALGTGLVVPGDLLELQGRDLGGRGSGRVLTLAGRAPGATVSLTPLSWSGSAVRVRVPDLRALGVDAREEAALEARLEAQRGRRTLGFEARLGFKLAGDWMGRPLRVRVVVVGQDVDGDGHAASPWGDDCDDFDPRRSPAHREVADPAGLDEDCDPDTRARPTPSAPATPEAAEEQAAAPAGRSATEGEDAAGTPEEDELDLDGPL